MKFDITIKADHGTTTYRGLTGSEAALVKRVAGNRVISITVRRVDHVR